jgi:hypothetical protein
MAQILKLLPRKPEALTSTSSTYQKTKQIQQINTTHKRLLWRREELSRGGKRVQGPNSFSLKA